MDLSLKEKKIEVVLSNMEGLEMEDEAVQNLHKILHSRQYSNFSFHLGAP